MKKYTRPNMDITKFAIEDIITVSGMIVNFSDLAGDDAEMYDAYMVNSTEKHTNVAIFTW